MDVAAVAHDDTLLHEVSVDAVGVGHLDEHEVGVGGIDFLADRQERAIGGGSGAPRESW